MTKWDFFPPSVTKGLFDTLEGTKYFEVLESPGEIEIPGENHILILSGLYEFRLAIATTALQRLTNVCLEGLILTK